MNDRIRSVLSMFLALVLALGALTLVGCGGSEDEQDNCYGEDMPVIND